MKRLEAALTHPRRGACGRHHARFRAGFLLGAGLLFVLENPLCQDGPTGKTDRDRALAPAAETGAPKPSGLGPLRDGTQTGAREADGSANPSEPQKPAAALPGQNDRANAPAGAGAQTQTAAPAAGPPDSVGVRIEDGVLWNDAYKIRFAVPAHWTLRKETGADEMVLDIPDCKGCLLRVLVTPGRIEGSSGEEVTLEETVRSLKKQILESPGARVLDEQRTRVARQKAYTLVKEETLPGAGDPGNAESQRVLSRYVMFNHRGDKLYVMLRATAEQFGVAEEGLETLLESFRFVPSE